MLQWLVDFDCLIAIQVRCNFDLGSVIHTPSAILRLYVVQYKSNIEQIHRGNDRLHTVLRPLGPRDRRIKAGAFLTLLQLFQSLNTT